MSLVLESHVEKIMKELKKRMTVHDNKAIRELFVSVFVKGFQRFKFYLINISVKVTSTELSRLRRQDKYIFERKLCG